MNIKTEMNVTVTEEHDISEDYKYDYIYPFKEGIAKVLVNGKYGFIDKEGNLLIEPIYTYVGDLSCGLIPATVDGMKYGYIYGDISKPDEFGKTAIPFIYNDAYEFSNGNDGCYATVLLFSTSEYNVNTCTIDREGILHSIVSGSLHSNYHNGFTIMKNHDVFEYYTYDGKLKFKVEGIEASKFNEGLTLVITDKHNARFLNEEGEVVCLIEGENIGKQDRMRYFCEGIAIVTRNNMQHYINRANFEEGALPVENAIIYKFCDGFASYIENASGSIEGGFLEKVQLPNNDIEFRKHNRVASSGKKFTGTGRFSEGVAPVKVDDNWGYVDKTMNFVIEPKFDHAHSFSDGYAIVTSDDTNFYIDKTGARVVRTNTYDTCISSIEELSEDTTHVRVNSYTASISDDKGNVKALVLGENGEDYEDFSKRLTQTITDINNEKIDAIIEAGATYKKKKGGACSENN